MNPRSRQNPLRPLFICLAIIVCGTATGQESRVELNKVQRQYLDQIKPILQQSCGDCHWGEASEGDINFEPFNSIDEILEATAKWKKVISQVTADEMPPPNESDPLTPNHKQLLLDWIDRLINTIDCTEINPGKATLRRLNRTEYQNTIHDLTGVNFTPASSFPGDDVGYGFDNIGDVLSLPPILMEKYYAAAEEILLEAIPESTNPGFDFYAIGSSLTVENNRGARATDNRVVMFSQSTVYRDIQFPRSTRYKFVLHAHAMQAGDEVAKAAVSIDGDRKKIIDIDSTEPGEKVFEFSLGLKKGKHRVAISFINDYYRADGPQPRDRNLLIDDLWIVNDKRKPDPTNRIIFKRPGFLPAEQSSIAREVLARFANFAFRRPATDSEVDRLLTLFHQARSEGDSFDAAIRFSLQAVLVSPHFLFKVEHPVGTGTRDLNSYELATSLSYFLWSTMPDAELFRLATSGELNNPEILDAQVRRMLSDNRGRALVENFAGQWLQLRSLRDFEPDPKLFPGVDDHLLADMVWETKMTVADIFLKDRSVLELLDNESTFLNESLARHYRIPNVTGEEFRKVSLKDQRPGGVLTQGSILTLTSNPTRTSPVKRGKWIMENLLGDSPPPPDPSVIPLDDQPELKGTIRERMEQHRADPNCASCHKTMDALGFALENFDAVGRWRDVEEENVAIDASAQLENGIAFSGASGLQNLLRTELKEKFVRCFTEKLLIYSLGRGLQYYDQCSVDTIMVQAAKDDFKFSSLVIAIVESEPFRKRRGRAADTKDEN